ncbi:hypothetical protein CYMTET_45450 [Cymbomonas tetramitiformis]|uniref:Uncharacterized protein n=1 Tax=Cymbomonas tetramitiformis TaxID=36881 RepID=A0AAE0EYK5_9CHLO|nr:hypothetical protein CYMTET_45450 [Cymbomonas tetramitiformis]
MKPGVRSDGHPLSMNFDDAEARTSGRVVDLTPRKVAEVSKVLRLSCPGGLQEVEDSLLVCNRSPESGAGHFVCLTNAFPAIGLLVVDAGGSRGEDGAIFWLKWGDDGMGGTIHDICGSRSPKWILQEVDRGRELGKPYGIAYYGTDERPGIFLVSDNQGHHVRYFRFDLAIIDGTIRRDVQLSGRLVGSGTPALRGGTADESGLCQ